MDIAVPKQNRRWGAYLAALVAVVGLAGVTGSVSRNPQKLKAELRVPEAQAEAVATGQLVRVAIQTEEVTGRVTRVDPGVRQGAVRVEVSFDQALPAAARLDLSVDGRIEIERVEFGIRAALGAEPRQLAALVLKKSLSLSGFGVGLGLLLALLLGRVTQAVLYETNAHDPATLLGVSLLLLLITCAAAALPTARAMRVNPVGSLREE